MEGHILEVCWRTEVRKELTLCLSGWNETEFLAVFQYCICQGFQSLIWAFRFWAFSCWIAQQTTQDQAVEAVRKKKKKKHKNGQPKMKPLLLFQNTNTNLAFCSLCLALWTHISTWFDTKYCLPLFNVIVNSGKNSDVTITVVCRVSQTASWQKWLSSSVGNVKSLPFWRILLSKLQLSKGWLK